MVLPITCGPRWLVLFPSNGATHLILKNHTRILNDCNCPAFLFSYPSRRFFPLCLLIDLSEFHGHTTTPSTT